MSTDSELEIFLVAVPGLEAALAGEARAKGFREVKAIKGGVTLAGRWPEVWRANLELRGASRVLARIASFRAMHLAQLDKRARRVPWAQVLRADVPVHVEAACGRSRIYHSGAAAERIARAITETIGCPVRDDAEVVIKARIDDDLATIAIDTSGEPLHKRGFRQAVAKAPMRETMASLYLGLCSFTGDEPVLDPMCGSGTFVIEAAEIASGLKPGRARHFAFERLATFDAAAWQAMRAAGSPVVPAVRFHGSDRDAGAIAMARANAERAGVSAFAEFSQRPVSEIAPPEGPKGLVMVNPPYGARIGETNDLVPLYRALGRVLMERFHGWRTGLVTSERALAAATGLPFKPPGAPVLHGGLRVTLYQTGPLP